MKKLFTILFCALLLPLVANSATYRNVVASENPSAGTLIIWVNSDTQFGEGIWGEIQYGASSSGPWSYASADGTYDTSYPGANWKITFSYPLGNGAAAFINVQLANRNQSNALYGYTGFGAASIQDALPVELTKLAATIKENNVLVAWETASEKNNNRFEIERSQNGYDWTKIGEVKGANNSNVARKYNFTDLTPARGVNYYRLHQVDNDGKATLSKVVSAALGVKGSLGVSPNPVSNVLTLDTDTEGADVSVFDLSGRLIKTIQNNANIDVSELAQGTYVVRVVRSGAVYQARFVKD